MMPNIIRESVHDDLEQDGMKSWTDALLCSIDDIIAWHANVAGPSSLVYYANYCNH